MKFLIHVLKMHKLLKQKVEKNFQHNIKSLFFSFLAKSLSEKARVLGTPSDTPETRARLYKKKIIASYPTKNFPLEMMTNDFFMILHRKPKEYYKI